MKVKRFLWKEGDRVITDQYHYFCPGCKHIHAVGVNVHKFNGDFEKPTFNPSILSEGGIRCHSYITDGKVQFLTDCGHDLKGQTVDLPEFTSDLSPYEYQAIDQSAMVTQKIEPPQKQPVRKNFLMDYKVTTK